jgi:hypothetical protein
VEVIRVVDMVTINLEGADTALVETKVAMVVVKEVDMVEIMTSLVRDNMPNSTPNNTVATPTPVFTTMRSPISRITTNRSHNQHPTLMSNKLSKLTKRFMDKVVNKVASNIVLKP